MAISFLERLATRGTGRWGAESFEHRRGRLVVYPSYIGYERLIRAPENRDIHNFHIEYDPAVCSDPKSIRVGFRLLVRLIKTLPRCEEMILFRCNRQYDKLCTLLTAIMARLAGVPVILCDYSFSSSLQKRSTRRLFSLCRRVELGDASGWESDMDGLVPVSFRIDDGNLSAYRAFAKNRSVPSVLVYGDFDDSKTVSLVRRAYDLVKQKYPRTEFRLVVPAGFEFEEASEERSNGSFRFCYPRTEREMQALFSETDTMMLVSPGGINRYFITRAHAAGYPVIVNGLDYPDTDTPGNAVLTAPRGSYTGLAEAVISLVDDDVHYRSFCA